MNSPPSHILAGTIGACGHIFYIRLGVSVMFYRDIRVDTLFDSSYVDKAIESAGLTKAREYPELSSLLGRYQKKLKKSLAYSFPFSYGETYSQCVRIDENNYYQMGWNIASAKKTVKRDRVPVSGVALKDLVNVVDQQYINRSHLEVALQNNAPIIVALYPPLNTEPRIFIIDGNHRVMAKFEAGQDEISAYVLSPEQHMKALIGEGYKVLYKIHHNYCLIVRYMGGEVTTEELAQSLYPL